MTLHKQTRLTPSRFRWLGYALIVIPLQAVWVWGLAFQWPPPRMEKPAAAPWVLLEYGSGQDMNAWDEWHGVWAPTLFALPTDRGFSRPLMIESIMVRPPVDQPPPMAVLLERHQLREQQSPAVSPNAWPDYRAMIAPLRMHDAPASMMQSEGTEEEDIVIAPLTVTWRNMNSPDREVESLVLRHPALTQAVAPWDAELSVYIDESGVVERALLDERTSDDQLNALLLRIAHSWRWVPSDRADVVQVQVTFRHLPATTDTGVAP